MKKIEGITCEQVRSRLDVYAGDESSVAADDGIGTHLEHCTDCAEAVEERVRVKNYLQRAVRSATAPDDLRLKIRNQIRANQQRVNAPFARRPLAFAAIPLFAVLCVSAWGVYSLLYRQQLPSATHEASLDRVPSAQTSELLNIGLGDHIHCALKSGFANQHFTFEEMTHHLGAEYSDLVPLVKEKAGAGYEVVVAHQCLYGGRQFVHLILRNGETVLSLVITGKHGESFAGKGSAAASQPSGAPLYQGRLHDFEVAGFETGSHLAFIVSNSTGGR